MDRSKNNDLVVKKQPTLLGKVIDFNDRESFVALAIEFENHLTSDNSDLQYFLYHVVFEDAVVYTYGCEILRSLIAETEHLIPAHKEEKYAFKTKDELRKFVFDTLTPVFEEIGRGGRMLEFFIEELGK